MDESQITGAASSYARKYALNGLLAIDDTKDADTEAPKQTEKPKAKPPVKKQEVKPVKKPEANPEPKPNFRKKLGDLLVEMYGKENAATELFKLTTFTNEAGKKIPGKSYLEKLSDAQAQTSYGKLKLIIKETIRVQNNKLKQAEEKVELGYDAGTGEVTETHGVEE